jgi:hypothetical protein
LGTVADVTRIRAPHRALRTLRFAALISLAGGFVAVFARWIAPHSAPTFRSPSAGDVLIDSRLTIGLIRLIGVMVAVYVAASLVALMRSGRWLIGFGGMSTSGLETGTLKRESLDLKHE